MDTIKKLILFLLLLLIPTQCSTKSDLCFGAMKGKADAPTDADYLVGTSNGMLTNEIVVGTSPGGVLGGTWASPTIDADAINDTHIDWGTGANQVNPADFVDQDIGDITITTGSWAVEDDSHAHTTATISGIDISADTNLAGTANEITLTDDTLSLHSAITRDTEWDTEGEVQTVWGSVNILLETEIDASSELASIMDDETGSGALVFGTSPTFTTQITCPLIIGTNIKPSADSTTAIQLQNAAGTSVLNIDTTNSRVGIGTTGPSFAGYDTKLHIKGSGTGVSGRTAFVVQNTSADSASDFFLVNSADKYLGAQISGPSYTAGEAANFFTVGGVSLGFLTDGGVQNTGTSPIIFLTGGYASTQETMRITAKGSAGSGNVGIGTTSPESLLEVQGAEATDSVLTLDADDGDDNADTWILESEAATNNLTFNNHTTEVATLSSAGNLQIDGDLDIDDDLNIDGGAITLSVDTNVTLTGGVNGISFDTNVLSIDATNDRVGIGTTEPGYKLDITHNQNALSAIRLTNTDSGNAARTGFYFTDGSYSSLLQYIGVGYTESGVFKQQSTLLSGSGGGGVALVSTHASGNLRFYTGGLADANERVRIDSSGNVGIGTTSPENLLEVQAIEATDAILTLDCDDGDDNADTWFIASEAATNNLTFDNHTTEVATLSSGGNLQLDGTLTANGDQVICDGDLTLDPAGNDVILDNANLQIQSTYAIKHTGTSDHFTELYGNDTDTGIYWDNTNKRWTLRYDNTGYYQFYPTDCEITPVVLGYAGFHVGTYGTNYRIDDASNGSGSATLYIGNKTIDTSAVSDKKVKRDIVDTKFGLSDLLKIKVRDFRYKKEYADDEALHTGMIAQELQPIFADAVFERKIGGEKAIEVNPREAKIDGRLKKGYKFINNKFYKIEILPEETVLSINYDKLVPLTIESIQELNNKIEELEAKIKKLEGR